MSNSDVSTSNSVMIAVCAPSLASLALEQTELTEMNNELLGQSSAGDGLKHRSEVFQM